MMVVSVPLDFIGSSFSQRVLDAEVQDFRYLHPKSKKQNAGIFERYVHPITAKL
jgi:hypothetical protein